MKKIDRFRGEYRFLSNFYIEPDGSHVEGEFQALKCSNPTDWKKFKGLGPMEAKALGYTIDLRKDWEDVKVDVMWECVRKKFEEHPSLATKLLATKDAVLVEGNNWCDKFWGLCDGTGPKCKGHEPTGRNMLGKILMMIREDLSDAPTPTNT